MLQLFKIVMVDFFSTRLCISCRLAI